MALPTASTPSCLPRGADQRLRRAQIVASTSVSVARAVLALALLATLCLALANALQTGADRVSQEMTISTPAKAQH
jgi:hypothetical protein